MKTGYIIAARGIWWNDHVPSGFGRGGEKLALNWIGWSSISGFKCDNCGLIVCYPGAEAGARKKERIICPQCGKAFSFTHASMSEDGSLRCPACGVDFLITDAEKQ